jgi:hypothetical protein
LAARRLRVLAPLRASPPCSPSQRQLWTLTAAWPGSVLDHSDHKR